MEANSKARILPLLACLALAACGGSSSTPEPGSGGGSGGTGNVTLSWSPPTERVDGSPLDRVAAYRIMYGQQSRQYSRQVNIGEGMTRYTIGDLGPGRWYFSMVAIDSAGLESTPSAEVSTTI